MEIFSTQKVQLGGIEMKTVSEVFNSAGINRLHN